MLIFHNDLQCDGLDTGLVRTVEKWDNVFCRDTTFRSWIASQAIAACYPRPAATACLIYIGVASVLIILKPEVFI